MQIPTSATIHPNRCVVGQQNVTTSLRSFDSVACSGQLTDGGKQLPWLLSHPLIDVFPKNAFKHTIIEAMDTGTIKCRGFG
jgi:hypothetical protein